MSNPLVFGHIGPVGPAITTHPSNQFTGVTNTTFGLGMNGQAGGGVSVLTLRPINMKDLSSAVFSAPITELEDLWRVKYGDSWVKASELNQDEFYSLAAQRLFVAHKLERHRVADAYEEVFKLIRS